LQFFKIIACKEILYYKDGYFYIITKKIDLVQASIYRIMENSVHLRQCL